MDRKQCQIDGIMDRFNCSDLTHIQEVVDDIRERYLSDFTLFFTDDRLCVSVGGVYAGEIHDISGLPRFYAE